MNSELKELWCDGFNSACNLILHEMNEMISGFDENSAPQSVLYLIDHVNKIKK